MAVPQRTCIGCRQVKAKRDLIRIVSLADDGIFVVDPSGKQKGRGAYICSSLSCVRKALQPEKLRKAFRMDVDSRISLENLDKLNQELTELIESYDY